MQQIDILFLDLDGTTVPSNGEALPSDRVTEAVQAVQQLMHVVIATGRPLQYARPIIDHLGLEGLSIFNGGAEITDVTTGERAYRKALPPEKVRQLASVALGYGYGVFADDIAARAPIASLDDVQEAAAKLLIESVPAGEAKSVAQALRAVPGVNAYVTTGWADSGLMDIHVTDKFADKGSAVRMLLGMLGLDKDQAMAIGDNMNDYPMLQAVGLRVVMGNAPPALKKLASHIVPPVEADGVAVAIETLLLR